VKNWEVFVHWLVVSEEGEAFIEAHPDVVDRWLRAFNEWARGLVGDG